MKKIFTFAALMMLGIMGTSAQTLINYPTSKDGTAISGTTTETTVKIHGNQDAVECYALKNGYSSNGEMNGNHIKLSTEGGFKAGDVLTIAGVINNKDAAKRATVVLLKSDDEVTATVVKKFEDFINSYTATEDPVEQSFTLEADYDALYLGRDGGTQAFVTLIKVERAAQEIQPGTATFDFTTDDLHVHGSAAGEQDAQVYNEHFIVDNVDMQLVGGQIPVRCYSNSSRGSFMQFGMGSQIILRAPEGGAITKVEFTIAGSGSINVTPSSGEFADGVWTGNATSLRLNVESTAAYLASVAVSYDKATEESDAMPGVLYTDVNGLAELATLDKGTIAKLTLTDAEVIAKSADGWGIAFIQDAGAGAWIQYSSLVDRLREETKISGTFYVTKNLTSNNGLLISEAEETPASQFEESDIEELSMVKGTLTEVNVAANAERVVKISGAAFKVTKVAGNAEQGELTQDDQTITVNNGFEGATNLLHKLQFVEGTEYQSCTIVAILSAKSKTAFQLLPLSIVEDDATSIESVARETAPAAIYNLQGQRISKLQKGLNIVDGKKVMF